MGQGSNFISWELLDKIYLGEYVHNNSWLQNKG